MVARVMPEIDVELCTLCGDCVTGCPQGAAEIVESKVVLDEASCVYCGSCEDLCPMGAIALPYDIVVSGGEATTTTSDTEER